ncbi:MAG: TMAO reductase system periplasmic protein TorT [Rhodospirillales bacterium]|nr:TMAO reductase system periplasmic protein TorT [Rhodospirillales bacterium]
MFWRKICWAVWMVLILTNSPPATAETWQVEAWNPAFDYRGVSEESTYEILHQGAKDWRLCIVYPHLKDPYWLSVNYGMVSEARRLGIGFRLMEAGGYLHLERQRIQINSCASQGADALILGTVSYGQLTDSIESIGKEMPVIAVINDISDKGIAAKIGVSWIEMGRITGIYLAKRHPKGQHPARVALFPGPIGPEWVQFVLEGFEQGIQGSAIEVVTIKHGDTGKEIQRNLVEDALEETPDVDYIVGTAVTAEAAISVLRNKNNDPIPRILSFYMTHGVYRGIKRGKVLAAPTDHPVLQGRMSIEQTVRVLEGKIIYKHFGPPIQMIDANNIGTINFDQSLAPASFVPVYEFP